MLKKIQIINRTGNDFAVELRDGKRIFKYSKLPSVEMISTRIRDKIIEQKGYEFVLNSGGYNYEILTAKQAKTKAEAKAKAEAEAKAEAKAKAE